jgi:hypothetical protein
MLDAWSSIHAVADFLMSFKNCRIGNIFVSPECLPASKQFVDHFRRNVGGILARGQQQEGSMLHKVSKLKGFHILATDHEAGHVDDFLVDESLTIRHMVVDTSNWLGGKSVLISPASIEKVDSPQQEIRVRLSHDEIARSPSLDTADIELIETLPPPII